jgi:hypothetical protein
VAHAGVERAVVGVLDAVGAQEVEVAALLGAEDVVSMIGVSDESWEAAARSAVEDRGQHRS